MKRNIRPSAASVTPEYSAADPRRVVRSFSPALPEGKAESGEKALCRGLLGLCHEIAGLILRRRMENRDAVAVRHEVRKRLVRMLSCPEERAERLIDLSLELIHVKIHGRFQRNPLELSLLIARAGNQLREAGDN